MKSNLVVTGDLPLRIIVEDPPAGVAIQVQRGRDELLAPTKSSKKRIAFDFVIRLGAPGTPGRLRFLGEFAQGPADARFIYVNSGVRAGQTDSCWERRAKVALKGITHDMARLVLDDKAQVLEACISGTARDGGPMCASVPLLHDGWTVVKRL